MVMDEHLPFMQRALVLARRGEGLTRPNPPVGAVLVQGGEVVAEGWHKKAGAPHAEVNCLRAWRRGPGAGRVGPGAGSRESAGAAPNPGVATLYVTLEPCSTRGRTPPCTDLILEHGIGRVVVGCNDPNPAHAGRGLRTLRRAGVDVITGVCKAEADMLIAPFAKRMRTGLPTVTLKLGVTLDGRIADGSGTSQWITGPQARKKVQALRRRVDAVMVGAGTVRADDPSLLPRPAKGRTPWRVVVGADIPEKSKILSDEAADRTLVFYTSNRLPRQHTGGEYVSVSATPSAGVVRTVLRNLAERGVMHVLCEGGGELAGSLLRAGLVDELMIFMAPSLLGGTGFPMVGKKGWALPDMPHLVFQSLERCGDDVLIRAVPGKEK